MDDGWLVMMCLTPCDPLNCNLPGSFVRGIFQASNTGVGCHFLFQRIFLTQGSNLHFLYCKQCLYVMNHWGSPVNHICMGLFLNYSASLCVRLFARTMLFWFLWLYTIIWNQKVSCLQLCFSFSRVLYLLGIFCDSIKLLGFSVKNAIGILMGTALHLWIALGSMDILIIFLQQMNTGYSFIYWYL